MKGDFKYHVESVQQPNRYRAAMRAVFNPILNAFYRGRQWAKGGYTVKNIAAAIAKVRYAWRRQVMALAQFRCPSVVRETREATKKNIRALRNCPPFGIKPFPADSNPCKHRLCPFCYGRRLIKGFKRIEKALYGTLDYKGADGKLVKPIRKDVMLVGFEIPYVATNKNPHEPMTLEQVQEALNHPDLLIAAYKRRRVEIDAYSSQAGLVGFRHWSDLMGQTGVFRCGVMLAKPTIRGLKYYTKHHAKIDNYKVPARFIYVAKPNKKMIAKLFAEVFSYPAEWLRCSPAIAALHVDKTWRLKLWNLHGKGTGPDAREHECLAVEDTADPAESRRPDVRKRPPDRQDAADQGRDVLEGDDHSRPPPSRQRKKSPGRRPLEAVGVRETVFSD